MIVKEMNPGTKIPYEVDEKRITFDDDLTINLSKREEDWPVHIDVCYDLDQNLVIGATNGNAYVAQIDIPARQYTEEQAEEHSETITKKVPVPFSMDGVTLSLFSVE